MKLATIEISLVIVCTDYQEPAAVALQVLERIDDDQDGGIAVLSTIDHVAKIEDISGRQLRIGARVCTLGEFVNEHQDLLDNNNRTTLAALGVNQSTDLEFAYTDVTAPPLTIMRLA